MRRVPNMITLALLASLAHRAVAQAGLVLDARTVIVESPDAPGPVKKAAEDLRNDLAKVFGSRPHLAADADTVAIEIVPPTGGKPETFSIAVRGNHVILSGADTRGTIYAIYQFSQDYLGVDPMYYWTDREPARRASIALPVPLSRVFDAPLFKYRGFFINDEDQLTGWAPGEQTDHSGISRAVMDRIFETILRLKGNMVVPGTWTFPTDPQMKWVGERGLILNQHHAIPVGVNVARWPADAPYNFTTHPEILERAWKNAVASYDPHQEILWSVGLRGLSDTAYSTMDPSVVGNDRQQGLLISKAIREQMAIVRAVQPDAKFVTTLWQEGARLMSRGHLSIPPEVGAVWADTGYGLVQDKGQVAKGQGVYYHVAMLNGRANQLSEMVPVERIHSEFGRFIAAGATNYMLLNTSDLRAVSMTAKAVMDVAWGGIPKEGSAGYYRGWAAQQFGGKAAAPLAKLYQDYFKAIPKLPSGDDYGDQIYHTEARLLLMTHMIAPPWYSIVGQAPRWTPVRILGLNIDPNYGRDIPANYGCEVVPRELRVCGEAQGAWDAVWKQALAVKKLVSSERKAFYDYYVLTGIAMNRGGNRMLYLVASAIHAAQKGDKAKARQEANEALAVIADIRKREAEAEYGKWRNWYRGEWLVGIGETKEMIEAFIRYLDDPLSPLPSPVIVNSWQAYYHIMHYEGDKSVDVH